MIAPDLDKIPGFLTAQPRWLLWRTKQRAVRKTDEITETKVPIAYRTGKVCNPHDPCNWIDFGTVQAALVRAHGAWDGPGFALGVVEQIGEVVIGLDLDTCLDEEGAPAVWALPFMRAMSSYSKFSPGGAGIKVVARVRLADLPAVRRLLDIPQSENDQARTRVFGDSANGAHAPGAQLFLMKRFFTVTGRHWPTAPEDVVLLKLEQIARIAEAFGPKEHRAAGGSYRDDDVHDDETEPDPATLRDKLRIAFVRNPCLEKRWKGGTQGLNDTTRSGRDMSVLAMLVAAGFTKSETRAALRQFEHGKLSDEPPRYFEQMWARTRATPHVNSAASQKWEPRHAASDGKTAKPDTKPKRRRPANVLALVTHINGETAWDGALRFNLLTENYEVCRRSRRKTVPKHRRAHCAILRTS
jgi:hypothetical protein